MDVVPNPPEGLILAICERTGISFGKITRNISKAIGTQFNKDIIKLEISEKKEI